MTSNLKIDPTWRLPEGFHYTQSNLQDFLTCQRRFYLRHVAQQRWPAPLAEPQDPIEQAVARGAKFHLLAERHQVGVDLELVRDSVAEDEAMLRWLENYESALAALGPFERAWAERRLSMMLPPHLEPILAKYDLLGVQNDQLIAVDWKTSRLPSSEVLGQRMQTVIYLLVLAKRGPALLKTPLQKISLHYISVDNGEQRTFRLSLDDSAEIHRLETLVLSVIANVRRSQEFPLVDDEQVCKYCIYRSLCERGQTAHLSLDEAIPDLDDLALIFDDTPPLDVEF
jgi:CRISPR/Cas system-associated exonuclease Cas4 (RecB family)